LPFGIYGAYFTSPEVIDAVIIPIVALPLLYTVFRRKSSPSVRSWSLGLMMLSSIFLWVFIGISLVACYAFSEAYELGIETGVRTAFGAALLLSIACGIPISLLLRRYSPRLVLAKVKDLSSPDAEITKDFERLCTEAGLTGVQLKISKIKLPISFAIDTQRPTVVISSNLLALLNREEVEAVIAHELAHIRNSDTALKAMVTAYKAALPQDPIIRLVEAAFHRERELAADETAAKVTRKPLTLASALLKIYEAFPKDNLRSYGTLSILGMSGTLMSRNPPISQRVNQLIRMAEVHK
jgi:Zn-dependent protease with chaperone function